MHIPAWQRSLVAQLSSFLQPNMQIPSLQRIPLEHPASLTHVFGIRTHSTSGFPVKVGGHEQVLTWLADWQRALSPQAFRSSQGFLQLPLKHTSLDKHSESDEQVAAKKIRTCNQERFKKERL
jgi:hypothetical protein